MRRVGVGLAALLRRRLSKRAAFGRETILAGPNQPSFLFSLSLNSTFSRSFPAVRFNSGFLEQGWLLGLQTGVMFQGWARAEQRSCRSGLQEPTAGYEWVSYVVSRYTVQYFVTPQYSQLLAK